MALHAKYALRCTRVAEVLYLLLAIAAFEATRTESLLSR